MLAAEDTFFFPLPSIIHLHVNSGCLADQGECCSKGNTTEKSLTSCLPKAVKVL